MAKEKDVTLAYRELNNEMLNQKAMVARAGGIDIVQNNLTKIDTLFQQSKQNNMLAKVINTHDAKSFSSVADLASISVRNMKLNKSGKQIQLDDFLIGAKKLMLEDTPGMQLRDFESVNDYKDTDEVSDEFLRSIEARNSEVRSQIMQETDFERFNMLKIGTMYLELSMCPITTDFLKGPLLIEKKARVVKQRRRDDLPETQATSALKPNLDTMSEKQDDTAAAVHKVFRELQKFDQKPVNLFRFFVDPTSFGKTIENMFYVSFLVRDGRVKITQQDSSDETSWVIQELSPDYEASGVEHTIFEMDYTKWQRLVNSLSITEPTFTL